MNQTVSVDRIAAGGVNVEQIQATNVLIKIDDIADREVWRHPVWNLSRGLGRLGVQSLEIHGATDYLESLAEVMRGLPFSQATGPWFLELVDQVDTDADLIVDLTNSQFSKLLSASLAASNQIPCLSVDWGRTSVELNYLGDPLEQVIASVSPEAANGLPLLPVARIASGMALQEILISVGQSEQIAATLFYNAADESRVEPGRIDWPQIALHNITVEVVGAGGTGVNFLEAFAPLLSGDCTVRVFDSDTVGSENLSMQIAYHPEDVGEPKATVMAKKLYKYCSARIQPFVMDYQGRPLELPSPSLRVLCPDNFEARLLANRASLEDGVPLIDLGSSPHAARVVVYQPGKTACLEHHLPGLAEQAAEERQRASCYRNREPTLPGTNMVCAGIAACEALRVLQPELFGEPSLGTILYDTRFADRFGIVDRRPVCNHVVSEERK